MFCKQRRAVTDIRRRKLPHRNALKDLLHHLSPLHLIKKSLAWHVTVYFNICLIIFIVSFKQKVLEGRNKQKYLFI